MIIAGPSHASRLRMAYESGEVAPPITAVDWLDRPGESIQSRFFKDSKLFSKGEPVFLFVTDFRLGNRRIISPDDPKAFSGIDGNLITYDNDYILYHETLDLLDRMIEENPRVELLFWSLAGREYKNRTEGRYFASGTYRHPVWNLKDVESRYSGNTRELLPLIEHPRAASLFSDESAHPSWLGNELITRMVDSKIGPAELFEEVLRTSPLPVLSFPRRTIITGHSVWLNRVKRMNDTGIIILENAEIVSIKEALDEAASASDSFDVIFVSSVREVNDAEIDRINRQIRLIKHFDSLAGGVCRIVFWEAWVSVTKGASATLGPAALEAAAPAHALRPSIARRHVDFHTLDPTLLGAKDLLQAMGAGLTWRRCPKSGASM